MPLPPPPLPIDDVLPALRAALGGAGGAVLQAPPGAGKTTRVPLALLDERWLEGGRIVMLEPRRLAARAAAHRMASLLGQAAGEWVGYRTRLETRVGRTTRVEVVTEGVLTRMLQSDPSLDGVGLVIFDEFHERSLHADLGLALTLLSRELLRPELRLLVMSATLDAEPVAALLGEAPRITSEGRAWPVEIRWLGSPPRRAVEPAVAAAVRRALAELDGDVLAFLPGRRELRGVEALLCGCGADVFALYGDLPPEVQNRAIQPGPPDRRKVVLATSIAETSLTIEGVRVVVDSGLARVPRFSARTGMTRLDTARVTRAAAEQRAGRAGRLGPGVCLRLWSEADHASLVPHHRPEILDADLAPLALELAAAGVNDPADLRWLDQPPAGALAQARALLSALGALDAAGRITPHGRAMAALPLHPRLAHLLLRAGDLGALEAGAALAALLEERDPLGDGPADADLRHRLEIVLARGTPRFSHGRAVRVDIIRRVREAAARLSRLVGRGGAAADSAGTHAAGLLLSLAFPDRIARRRAGGGAAARYLLRNGRGATLDPSDPLAREPWLVAAHVADTGAEGRIHLAAPVDEGVLVAEHGSALVREPEVVWDESRGAVAARVVERLGAIVLRETPLHDPDPELVSGALLDAVRRRGITSLPWSPTAVGIRRRVEFLRKLEPGRWPDFSDAGLARSLEDWLGPHLSGVRSLAELGRVDLPALLRSALGWELAAELDRAAPTHLVVPTGSRLPLDYESGEPVLAVRLQEMFGAGETPRIAGGRVAVMLHLLSPARRPVQVTRDLGGFWRGSYADVRKELRGRYPKHEWPEDPLHAAPTRRTKPRS